MTRTAPVPIPAPNLGPGPGPNLGPIPTGAHAGTTVDLAPAQGPIVADLTVGPIVGSAGAEAIVAPPCLIAAGTSATELIPTPTPAWECLA